MNLLRILFLICWHIFCIKCLNTLEKAQNISAQLRPIDVYSIKLHLMLKFSSWSNLFCPAQMYGSSFFFMFLAWLSFFFSCWTVLGYDQIKQNYNLYICSLAFKVWTQELTFHPIIVGRGCAILVRVHWALWLL